jgi:anthranilate phosphoribosyltransferase
VVKHGNRGITSKSGGADVLEALGIRIDMPPEGFRRCVKEAGIGFLFAPNYHPAFKAVAGVRKNLAAAGHRSIFNLIGPLLNPARPQCQLVGISDRSLCPAFAEILQRLGRESAWVVSGNAPGNRAVDEISIMGSTLICKSGSYQDLEDEEINPEDFGLRKATVDDLQGGDAKTNAAILENILSGKDTGHKADIVLLNAAAALACAGLADHMGDALEIARETITSGTALEKLRLLQKAAQ